MEARRRRCVPRALTQHNPERERDCSERVYHGVHVGRYSTYLGPTLSTDTHMIQPLLTV